MKIKAYVKFRYYYRKLSKETRRKVLRQIRRLARNIYHPSLQCKKIRGSEGIFEVRIDLRYRMTFEVLGETILLRVVGNHDEVLKSP